MYILNKYYLSIEYLCSVSIQSLNPGVSTIVRRSLTPFSSISMYFFSISTVLLKLSVTYNVVFLNYWLCGDGTNAVEAFPYSIMSWFNYSATCLISTAKCLPWTCLISTAKCLPWTCLISTAKCLPWTCLISTAKCLPWTCLISTAKCLPWTCLISTAKCLPWTCLIRTSKCLPWTVLIIQVFWLDNVHKQHSRLNKLGLAVPIEQMSSLLHKWPFWQVALHLISLLLPIFISIIIINLCIEYLFHCICNIWCDAKLIMTCFSAYFIYLYVIFTIL